MNQPDRQPSGPGSWEIGGTRIMRHADFLEKRHAEQEAMRRSREAEAGPRARPGWMIAAELREKRIAEARPAPPEPDQLTDHNYDGIQEYDNPTPGWWWMIFAGSIAYAVLFVICYYFVPLPLMPTPQRAHQIAETAYLNEQFSELNKIEMGEEKILRIMGEEQWLASGESIFQTTCALCHLADGSGSVGPNLTDEYYKNIDSLMGIVEIVTNGAANGQMPAQKAAFSETEIALVSAYVASLRGKNLEGKEPEGVEVPPFPRPIPSNPLPTVGLTTP